LLVGRSPDCDIVVDCQAVSRKHARIGCTSAEAWLIDLDSANGVLVNGVPLRSGSLKEGDTISIGSAVFSLRQAKSSRLRSAVIESGRARRLDEDILNESAGNRLPVLYRAAMLMGRVFELDDVLDKLLALIFEALPVRRAYILSFEGDTSTMNVLASRTKNGLPGGAPLSHTLLDHVRKTHEPILTLDAQVDDRFAAHESIISHEIHAAMCAPLFSRGKLVGVIYADSGQLAGRFSGSDLELLAAIGCVAGTAVDNARLYRENIERERMAGLGLAAANLGHCIKNILTGVRGGKDYIALGIEEQRWERVQKGQGILSRSVERLENLVLNTLEYSRERTPGQNLVDLNALLREIGESVAPEMDRRGIKFALTEAQDLPPVVLDQSAIFRAVLNLVLNAIDACPQDKGYVHLACKRVDGGVMIHVRDNGPGIPDELIPRLFTLFTSSKGNAGTGLGLACVYKIVQEHKGKVEAKNAPSGGAVFQISLPLELGTFGTQLG